MKRWWWWCVCVCVCVCVWSVRVNKLTAWYHVNIILSQSLNNYICTACTVKYNHLIFIFWLKDEHKLWSFPHVPHTCFPRINCCWCCVVCDACQLSLSAHRPTAALIEEDELKLSAQCVCVCVCVCCWEDHPCSCCFLSESEAHHWRQTVPQNHCTVYSETTSLQALTAEDRHWD